MTDAKNRLFTNACLKIILQPDMPQLVITTINHVNPKEAGKYKFNQI